MKSFLIIILFGFLVSCSSNKKFAEPGQSRLPSSSMVLDKSGYLYDPNDTSCDGYPMLQVETMPGTCLGLVLGRSRANDPESDKSFIKPRTIVQIPNKNEFFVIDMGGWKPNNGRLFWLKKFDGKRFSIKLVKFGLNTPHGLRAPGDGYFYVGEKNRIIRFKFEEGVYSDEQVVVDDLPSFEGHMHPLTQFVFDSRNMDLYINSGAPSDHCFQEGSGDYKYCPEESTSGLAAIYRIPGEKIKTLPRGGIKYYEIAASGLRNSMAMVVHPSGHLLQAENARDFPEFQEPYEELNVIELNNRGAHYGWPYCYNFHATSPEWDFKENQSSLMYKKFTKPVDCTRSISDGPGTYQAPYILLPPHAAPLDMNYYNGSMFSDLFGGQLLISLHGHQPTGNRFVSYRVDEQGLPILEQNPKTAKFYIDQEAGCPSETDFTPRGGLVRNAKFNEIISGWKKIKGVRPEGAPVGFTVAKDGSIWIVEDRENRTILRLARVSSVKTFRDKCSGLNASFIEPEIKYLAYRHLHETHPELKQRFDSVKQNLVKNYCLGCHGDFKVKNIADDEYSELDFFIQSEWITPAVPEESKIYGGIAHLEAYTPMPPKDKPQFLGTSEGDKLLENVRQWIAGIESNISESYLKYKVDTNRNIRNIPTTKGSIQCGQLKTGDIVYIANRVLNKTIVADGWHWQKVFLVRDHTRLFQNRCSGGKHPKDGVFYFAKQRAN